MLKSGLAEGGALPDRAAPLQRLKGRVAVVAGSSRGIGRAIARALGDEGAAIAVHYCLASEQAESLAQEMDVRGTRVRVLQADLSRPEDCHRLLDRAARELGPVDILVNNASAGVARDRSLRKMTAAEWDEVIATNLSSVFHCCKAAIEPMIQRGWGRIINVASIARQTGAFGQANYAAAEAGVIAFTKSVAQELARNGITVNAVSRALVETDMNAGMPAQEVARLVRFLCTEGDWITGAQLNINGGQYM